MSELFESTGYLRYSIEPDVGHKLVLEADPAIGAYYRSLVPKYVNLAPQRYPTHISIVRHETPPNLEAWAKYDGQPVTFFYDNDIKNGKVYYWLNAFSVRLEEIRRELGLPVHSEYTVPPTGFIKCFHLTLGNTKAHASTL